ncbi:hypothetical protein PR048_021627 [Dryococelus australis]|uniref:Uncharacterized protein n=1 Tax=Dryococelus australis TaxID=614101 RepID=A0ABQ9GYR0_9NEOP|nr:hypothetical protein PR048_021627 [Dryococelus australis]
MLKEYPGADDVMQVAEVCTQQRIVKCPVASALTTKTLLPLQRDDQLNQARMVPVSHKADRSTGFSSLNAISPHDLMSQLLRHFIKFLDALSFNWAQDRAILAHVRNPYTCPWLQVYQCLSAVLGIVVPARPLLDTVIISEERLQASPPTLGFQGGT